MSVLFTEKEKRETVEFLRRFVAVRPNAFGEDEPLPFRVTPLSISVNEVEGECIDWCLQYLKISEAPEIVTALLTHTVVKQITERDLSTYRIDESEDALLDAPKIAKDVINKVVEVCKQWDNEPPCFYRSKMLCESYVHAIKNTRRKMEDKHVILPQYNNMFGFPQEYTNQAFFAVYDGHSGVDASSYAATHLHCHLARNKNIDTDPTLALKEAFEKTDECFVAKAKREGLRSGSTGVAVLIKGETLYVAWLGDSQVLLSKAGQPCVLMNPHKPNREDERQRIEALGGCVVFFGAWRVNGSLSVSRAIGDAEHKPYVSGEPDTNQCDLEGDEDFLILACDGLWDVVKAGQAVDLVVQHLAEGGDRSSVAKLLVDSAKSRGSNDNISVVVVFLDSHKKDFPVKDIRDNFASTALADKEEYVCFDEKVTNSSGDTSENINSKSTGEKSLISSSKLSTNSPKSSCGSQNLEDGNTLEEQNSPITQSSKSVQSTAAS